MTLRRVWVEGAGGRSRGMVVRRDDERQLGVWASEAQRSSAWGRSGLAW